MATVSEYGVIKGVSDGSVTITATAQDGSGISSSCSLTVKTVTAESFSLAKDEITMIGGRPCRIVYTLEPEDSVLETLVWSSSNEEVATVNQYGVVRAIKKGSATITAVNTATGQEESCKVTVKRGPLTPLATIEESSYYLDEEGTYRRYSEKKEEQNTARLMLTGDIMSLSAQQNAAKTGPTFDFNAGFQYVKNLFAEADFVIGNLETTVSYSNPYTCEKKGDRREPSL